MANGEEDLKEKNKEESIIKKAKPHEYSDWKNFQGREDAEMLQEQSSGWTAFKSSRGEYDGWGED